MSSEAVPAPGRDALEALGRWADELARPEFAFGRWDRGPEGTLGYVELLPDGLRFLRAIGELGFVVPLDWPAWLAGAGSRYREDRARIADAPAADLVRLLTAIVRSDRFSEGALLDAFETGLLEAIARRARALAAT